MDVWNSYVQTLADLNVTDGTPHKNIKQCIDFRSKSLATDSCLKPCTGIGPYPNYVRLTT